MIDFSTLQGLIIPEGSISEISIGGTVVWSAHKPVVLEVEKQKYGNIYADGTWYVNENFVLLNIYPKNSNSIVNVTYGGLTKTLNFSEKTPQQVYFGTFKGVSDDVETPASGTLIIEGGYEAFGIGKFRSSSSSPQTTCDCITAITNFGTPNYIPNRAFERCSNLTFIDELPARVTSIGNYAFSFCTSLTSITISDSVTSIGEHAFERCTCLTSITIPDSVTSIGEYAFESCYNLKTVELPNGLTSIGMYAFWGCSSLTLTELPSGLTSISECVFSGCYNINIRVIPEGVTSIDYGAFMMGDTQQFAMWEADITLPSTLRSISDMSFVVEICPDDSDNWEMLWHPKSLTILAVEPPTLEQYNSSLVSIGNLSRITVPKGCGEAYKTAEGWNLYADIIVEASE